MKVALTENKLREMVEQTVRNTVNELFEDPAVQQMACCHNAKKEMKLKKLGKEFDQDTQEYKNEGKNQLKNKISESVGKKLRESMEDQGIGDDIQDGQILTPEEVMKYASQGMTFSMVRESGNADCVTRINSPEGYRHAMERGISMKVYPKRTEDGRVRYERLGEEQIAGWKAKREDVYTHSVELEPVFKDGQLNDMWKQAVEDFYEDKSSWIDRYGSN